MLKNTLIMMLLKINVYNVLVLAILVMDLTNVLLGKFYKIILL